MDWYRARPILMQITKGLRAAHGNGIIHRDMKPENVYLIQKEGRPDFVKVLDFGIAKIVNPDESGGGPALTQTGMIFGTPEYMSPEQAQGSTPDHRVDVYAVGCIMYHMLTGQVPFTADNFMGILTKHLLETPVPPRKRRPDLDIWPEVEAICQRAMEKDRDKRYPDMDAFYRALGGAGDMPFEPSQVFVPPRVPKASMKYPTLAAANQQAQEGRTALGTFDDERPVRPDEAIGGSRKGLIVGAIVGVLLLAGALVFALKPASKSAAPVEAAAAAKPAAAQPTSAPAVPPAAEAAKPVEPAKPAAEAKAEATPAPAAERSESRSHRHRRAEQTDEPRADPLHRAIPVPAEAPPTPAEIKPFPTN
jgi:serine/threonine-protein kinase